MKILIIPAHPRTGSFNHAIAETAGEMLGKCCDAVAVCDLYL